MATTYEAIATVTVGSGGAANIEFTSIPATYTDLLILASVRSTGGNGTCNVYFNNDTTDANYDSRRLLGDGSSASSGNQPDLPYFLYANASTMTSNTFASNCLYIPNYAGSNYKSISLDVVMENNATLAYSFLVAGIWNSTSAITSIKLDPASGSENFTQYSTATLYGIKNS